MKRNIPSGVAFLVILSAAFVVGSMAAYVVSTSTRIDTDPVQLNIPKRMAQDEPALLIPSDWVEHRIEEYGFAVSVPPGHDFASQLSEFDIQRMQFFVWPDGARESRWGIDVWDVSTWDEGGSPADFIEHWRKFEFGTYGPMNRESIEATSVGGVSATLVTITDDAHPDWAWKSIFLERRGHVIRIEDGAWNDEDFDIFLSSFEFIDETSGIAI